MDSLGNGAWSWPVLPEGARDPRLATLKLRFEASMDAHAVTCVRV